MINNVVFFLIFSHDETLPPYPDSNTSTSKKRFNIVIDNLMFTKHVDPMKNHRENCKCPLHKIIDSVLIPEQQFMKQQTHPQKLPQPRITVKLTEKQRRFLNERVFKPQWIRLQVEAKEEEKRYALYKLSEWQKKQISDIHAIEKRLLEKYQISLTHYIVMDSTKNIQSKHNTTYQPPREPKTQWKKPEPGMTQQRMPEPEVIQQRMAEPQVIQQSIPEPQKGTQQRIPKPQAARQRTQNIPYLEPQLYSYYDAGQTMPIRSGGLLNVRPASFLQNYNGFVNVPNSPVLENMNRMYKMYDLSLKRTEDLGGNVDSGGSNFSGGNENNVDYGFAGIQDTEPCDMDTQSSEVYTIDMENAVTYTMDAQNTGECAMDVQNTETCPMDVQENTTSLPQGQQCMRHVILDLQQQKNYNSYRERKNWRKTPSTQPYSVMKKNDELNSPSSSYNVLAQQQDQNAFFSLDSHLHAINRVDQNDFPKPHTPSVINEHSRYLARSVPDDVPVNPHFKRPLNPPYLYPENIKPRTPPPPYPTDIVYHQQCARPGQTQFPQPAKQYQQAAHQYPQPTMQYSQSGQQYPQLSQQFPQPGQQYVQPGQQYLQLGQQYPQSSQHCAQLSQQCPPPGQQYPQPAPPQYQQSATPLLYYI